MNISFSIGKLVIDMPDTVNLEVFEGTVKGGTLENLEFKVEVTEASELIDAAEVLVNHVGKALNSSVNHIGTTVNNPEAANKWADTIRAAMKDTAEANAAFRAKAQQKAE